MKYGLVYYTNILYTDKDAQEKVTRAQVKDVRTTYSGSAKASRDVATG